MIKILHFSWCKIVSSFKCSKCFQALLLLKKRCKSKIKENPFFKKWTPSHILIFNVSVNHFKWMHCFQIFHKISRKLFCIFRAPRIYCWTKLHTELHRIIKINEIKPKHPLKSWTKLQQRGNFQWKILV